MASHLRAFQRFPIEVMTVLHVDGTLEDQMCSFTSDFDRSRAGYSPDRVGALVWALTELCEPSSEVHTGLRIRKFRSWKALTISFDRSFAKIPT